MSSTDALGGSVRPVRVEILSVNGCPHRAAAHELARRTGDELGIVLDVTLVEVATCDEAERWRFLGSPSIRVDGRDIEPEAEERHDYALACRLYRGETGLRPLPDERLVRTALTRASDGLP